MNVRFDETLVRAFARASKRARKEKRVVYLDRTYTGFRVNMERNSDVCACIAVFFASGEWDWAFAEGVGRE